MSTFEVFGEGWTRLMRTRPESTESVLELDQAADVEFLCGDGSVTPAMRFTAGQTKVTGYVAYRVVASFGARR